MKLLKSLRGSTCYLYFSLQETKTHFEHFFPLSSFTYQPETDLVTDEIFDMLHAEAHILAAIATADEMRGLNPIEAAEIYCEQAQNGYKLAAIAQQQLGEEQRLQYLEGVVYNHAKQAMTIFNEVLANTSIMHVDNLRAYQRCYSICTTVCTEFLQLNSMKFDSYKEFQFHHWELELDWLNESKQRIDAIIEVDAHHDLARIRISLPSKDESCCHNIQKPCLFIWEKVTYHICSIPKQEVSPFRSSNIMSQVGVGSEASVSAAAAELSNLNLARRHQFTIE